MMNRNGTKAAVTLALALAGGCSGGGSGSQVTQTITMGAVVDSTGSAGDGNWANAISLATNEVNAALAAAKSSIRFEFLINDSTNVPTVAVPRAQDLVTNQGAKALVTDTTQDTLETLKLQYDPDPTKHLDVPIVGLAPTSPSFGNPNATNSDALTQAAYQDVENWASRTVMSTVSHGLVLAELVAAQGTNGDLNGDGKVKVGIIASDEPFGRGYISVLKAALATTLPSAITESILFPTTVDPNDITFFADQYALLVDAHNEETGLDDGYPDMLFVFTFPSQSASVIKAHVQAGATVPMLGGMGLRANKVLASLGSDANGQGGVSPILVEPNASGDVFSADLKAMTGLPPAQLDGASYDAAVTLMLSALIAARDQADPTMLTGAQIRDSLRSTSDPAGQIVRTGTTELTNAVTLIAQGQAINYEGASGSCDFDENGNVTTRIARFTVVNGAFTDTALFNCVQDPSCPQQ